MGPVPELSVDISQTFFIQITVSEAAMLPAQSKIIPKQTK